MLRKGGQFSIVRLPDLLRNAVAVASAKGNKFRFNFIRDVRNETSAEVWETVDESRRTYRGTLLQIDGYSKITVLFP
jgi:hypothetical protein